MTTCFKCKELKKTIDGKEKEIKALKESIKTKDDRNQALLKLNQEILEPLVRKYMSEPKTSICSPEAQDAAPAN